jgi:transposase
MRTLKLTLKGFKMYYVGIDVAEKKHYVCILDDAGEFAVKPFWIYTDILGLRRLIEQFANLSLDNDDFIIGIESTGAFSENLYEYITDNDYQAVLLNAYQTAKFRDFRTIRKVKNDAIDAYVIAELLSTGKYKESHISNDAYHSVKVLGRTKRSLEKKIKTIKREISTVMATVNPEIGRVFPNIFTKTALAIIKVYPTAIDMQKATPKKLTRLFRHIKGNNFSEDKAKFLIDLANTSVYAGRAYEARSLMITTNIRILELLCQEKKHIEEQIKQLITEEINTIDNSIENLQSIPGISDKTISAILGECGDLRRFDSAKAFIGYLGLYPTQYQSGNSNSIGRLAKRGIPIAKHALYMAAVGSVLHNPQLNKIFRDKVSSGKSKKEALIIISKKIAAIMYSIVKHNEPYQAHRVFIPNR